MKRSKKPRCRARAETVDARERCEGHRGHKEWHYYTVYRLYHGVPVPIQIEF